LGVAEGLIGEVEEDALLDGEVLADVSDETEKEEAGFDDGLLGVNLAEGGGNAVMLVAHGFQGASNALVFGRQSVEKELVFGGGMSGEEGFEKGGALAKLRERP
jgi:hypothetical protein